MSTCGRALGLILVGLLAGLVVQQRTVRLRKSYELRRLADDVGAIRNEVRWLDAQVSKLTTPAALLSRVSDEFPEESFSGRTVIGPGPIRNRSQP